MIGPSNHIGIATNLTRSCLEAVGRNDRNNLLFNRDTRSFQTKATAIENAASASSLKIRGHATTFFRGIGGFQGQMGKALTDLKALTQQIDSEYIAAPQEEKARMKEQWQILQVSLALLRDRVSATFNNNPKLTALADDISKTVDRRVESFAREHPEEPALDVGSSEEAISILKDLDYRPLEASFQKLQQSYEEASELPLKERCNCLAELSVQVSRLVKSAVLNKNQDQRYSSLAASGRELRGLIDNELKDLKIQSLKQELEQTGSSIVWGQPPAAFTGGTFTHPGKSTLASNLMQQTTGGAALDAGGGGILLPSLFLSDIVRMGRVSVNRDLLYCDDPTESETLIERDDRPAGNYASIIQNGLGLSDEKFQALVLLANQDFQRESLENLIMATESGYENILDYQKWHMDFSVGADDTIVITSTKVFQVMPTEEHPDIGFIATKREFKVLKSDIPAYGETRNVNVGIGEVQDAYSPCCNSPEAAIEALR